MRQSPTLIGAMMIHRGDAEGMLCGTYGTHAQHRVYIDQVIGLRRGVRTYSAMNAVMLPNRTVFIADTYVNPDPTAEQLAEITILAAEEIRRFGIAPKIALLSHSSFGTSDDPQARKMRAAVRLINAMDPELEVEGEMHGVAAQGRREPAHHADTRCREHLVQSAEGGLRRRRHARPDPARRRAARAHPDALGHRAADREHDRADRGRLHAATTAIAVGTSSLAQC
jgi:hypothetical protein